MSADAVKRTSPHTDTDATAALCAENRSTHSRSAHAYSPTVPSPRPAGGAAVGSACRRVNERRVEHPRAAARRCVFVRSDVCDSHVDNDHISRLFAPREVPHDKSRVHTARDEPRGVLGRLRHEERARAYGLVISWQRGQLVRCSPRSHGDVSLVVRQRERIVIQKCHLVDLFPTGRS